MLDIFLPCILGLFLPNLVASECFKYLVLCMCLLWALALSIFFLWQYYTLNPWPHTSTLLSYPSTYIFVLKKNCTVSQAGFELVTLP